MSFGDDDARQRKELKKRPDESLAEYNRRTANISDGVFSGHPGRGHLRSVPLDKHSDSHVSTSSNPAADATQPAAGQQDEQHDAPRNRSHNRSTQSLPAMSDDDIARFAYYGSDEIFGDIGDDSSVSLPVEATRERIAIEQFMREINLMPIRQAYIAFCGKTPIPEESNPSGDGNMIRCPNSDHRDTDPSAWYHAGYNIWSCGKCEGQSGKKDGGDNFSLAAAAMGYTTQASRSGKNFHAIIHAIINKNPGQFPDYSVIEDSTGKSRLMTTEQLEELERESEKRKEFNRKLSEEHLASLEKKAKNLSSSEVDSIKKEFSPSEKMYYAKMYARLDGRAEYNHSERRSDTNGWTYSQEAIDYGLECAEKLSEKLEHEMPAASFNSPTGTVSRLLHQNVFPAGTAIREYVDELSRSKASFPEYHVGNALMITALILGRNVKLIDGRKPVLPNLMSCLVGESGEGKTDSIRYMEDVVKSLSPFNVAGGVPSGVMTKDGVSSPEYLIKALSECEDPKTGKPIPVSGVVALFKYEEIKLLNAKSSRSGNPLKDYYQQLYDNRETGSASLANEITAKNHSVSVISTTQRKNVAERFTSDDRESGYLNRWVFFMSDNDTEVQSNPLADGVILDTQDAEQLFAEIKTWGENIFFNGSGEIHFSSDALAVFDVWYKKEYKKDTDDETEVDVEDSPIRGDLLVKKLILIIAANKMEETVSWTTVRQAISMWPYFLSAYKVVDKSIGYTTLNKAEQKVIKMAYMHQVSSKGELIKRSTVCDAIKRSSGMSTAEFNRLVDSLVENGNISIEEGEGGKRGPKPKAIKALTTPVLTESEEKRTRRNAK